VANFVIYIPFSSGYIKSQLLGGGRIMSQPEITIVGTSSLQNELLARFLENEIGSKCVCSTNNHWNLGCNGTNGGSHLTLLDYQSLEWEAFPAQLDFRKSPETQLVFAFFNVCSADDSRIVSKALLAHGLRGVFDEGESLEMICRGVRVMLNQELWIPRKVMEGLLLEPKLEPLPTESHVPLTAREREILMIIASGATNQQIADQLFISSHTVRTHIHNIFAKISVTSRLQAALWVTSNLKSNPIKKSGRSSSTL
jgi:DNA-binding NarL/FixJ family response regulator